MHASQRFLTIVFAVGSLLVVHVASPLPAAADEDFGERYRSVQQALQRSLRDVGSRERLQEVIRQRREATEELVAEIEAVDPAERDLDTIRTLARCYYDLGRHDEAIEHARLVLDQEDDLAARQTLISALVAAQRLDEAEEELRAALEQAADPRLLASLHMILARGFAQSGEPVRAADQYQAYVDHQIELLKTAGGRGPVPVSVIRQMVAPLEGAGQGDEALRRLDAQIAAVEDVLAMASDADVAAGLGDLQVQKATLLGRLGRGDEAKRMLADLLAEAQKAHEGDPDDAVKTQRLADLMRAQLDVAVSSDAADAGELRQQYLAFLNAEVARHPASRPIFQAWQSATLGAIADATRSGNAAAAAELLKAAEQTLDSIPQDDPAVAGLVTSARAQLRSQQRRIESELVRAELIGQPYVPIVADAWVNSPPLTEADLAGKVQLLDFWAVWCGPCIATFPHLRDWHERFADDGLVILGLTRYYGYEWDAAAERAQAAEGEITPEQEQAAVAAFAQHHQLKYPLVFMPRESDLSSAYGVTGIPQAVLVDRNGIIRMIRVGSGDQNAHDLEEMIEQLLTETPSAGDAASQ